MPRYATLVPLLGLLAACSPASEDRETRAMLERLVAARGEVSGQCLDRIWRRQDNPRRAFDRAHDDVAGGSIACATGTSASAFEASLNALRTAANERDLARLRRELRLPLLYIDRTGLRRELRAEELDDETLAQVFAPRVLAALADLELAEMTLVPGEGGFFALGAFWLVVPRTGARPQLVTLNAQALDEALGEQAGAVAAR